MWSVERATWLFPVVAILMLGACAVGSPFSENLVEAQWSTVAPITPSLPSPWKTDMIAYSETLGEGSPGKTEFVVFDGSQEPGRGEVELILLCVQPANSIERCDYSGPQTHYELVPARRFQQAPTRIEITCTSQACSETTLLNFVEAWAPSES